MSRQLFEDAKKVLLSEATKLDPVGREDKDIDNDGDSDKTDSYLKKRRGAISAAIAQSKNEGVELSEEDAQRLSDILKGVSEAKSDDPDYDEDLERFKKGLPAKKRKSVDEKNDTFDKKSHQYNVTMKYAERPTVQQRMAAHDIKPGIKGYRDRIDLLKDLERTGRLKKEETDQIDEVSRETLAAYKNKASDARYRKTLPTAKLDKREAGVAMAMKKLDKKNEETELDEGSGPKEKQKTPYRDINSPESRAAASAQREKMAAADKAEAGKKLLDRINAKTGVKEEVVVEGSEWETRHDEFTTVGDRATPEQINKIVSALSVAAKQASSKRGFLNQIIGKQSNGDLARKAYGAEILAKNIQRNSNAKPGTDERKELGQHLVYAVSLLKRMNGEQVVAEGSEKHKQSRLWQMISDYEKRAKATSNDIKKAHNLKMAQELRYKLKTSDDQGVAEGGIEKPIDPRLKRASFLPPAKGTYAADLAAGRYKSKRKPDAKKSETMKNEEVEQLDELGNTWKGRKKLKAVMNRAMDKIDGRTAGGATLSGDRFNKMVKDANTMTGAFKRIQDRGTKFAEEVEQVDEIYSWYNDDHFAGAAHARKYPQDSVEVAIKKNLPPDASEKRIADFKLGHANALEGVKKIAAHNFNTRTRFTNRYGRRTEEVEQVDERVIKGKGYDNPENMRKAPEGNVAMTSLMPGFDERSARFLARQVKGTMVKGKAQSAPQKEDVDLQEYELIEKFNVNIPEMPSYQDYVNAALKIAECKSFSELSEEDQEYIMNELEEAVATNDVSFILEAEAMSDMNDTVQRLKKAGHTIEDMGRDYRGNPFYVYIDKTNNMRRKVTYKGMQKMTQNMGRVQPEKEED